MMSLSSLPIFAAAIAVLGVGALYALHHLRTQPKRQTTASLLFWQHAARPQQTRVPWSRRFTHRRTFSLLATIVLLLTAAMLADHWQTASDAGHDVIVIDNGQAMAEENAAGQTALRQATDAAQSDIANTSGPLTVISAGAIPRVIAEEGTPVAAIKQALNALKTQPGASAASLALRLAASVQGRSPGRIIWHTQARELPADLPESIVSRVTLRTVRAAAAAAIVSVSTPTFSTANGQRLLRVTVAGDSSDGLSLKSVADGGTATIYPLSHAAVRREVRELEVSSATKRVELSLVRNEEPLGQTVSIDIPAERRMTYRVSAAAPEPLKAALHAVATESANGDIAIVAGDSPAPADARAVIRIIPATAIPTSPTLALVSNDAEAISLDQASTNRVPAAALPGVALMRTGDISVASIDTTAKLPTLYLSAGLLDEQAELPRRAAFPVLISEWCGRLLSQPATSVAVPWLRSAEDPLWLRPSSDALPRTAVTVADHPTENVTDHSVATVTPPAAHRSIPLKQTLLSIALLLLAVEGFLLARRKIV
ncbi:MAG: hypothetical protein QM754_09465 [Tepidisphaeraceae bacterium]